MFIDFRGEMHLSVAMRNVFIDKVILFHIDLLIELIKSLNDRFS